MQRLHNSSKAFKSFSFFILLLLASTARGALSKTYPTSPVTDLRIETYMDGFNTMWNSTWTVKVSTWQALISTWTYIYPYQNVTGWIAIPKSTYSPVPNSTETIKIFSWSILNSTWPIQDYTNMIIENTKLKIINDILDNGIEQYMVIDSTTSSNIIGGWKGWCFDGKIAVDCK